MDNDAAEDGPVYAYKPSLMGAPWVFRLTGEGIAWQAGNHYGVVPYDRVRRVRLSFRPATLQHHRFLAEIWATHAPKLRIFSTSWRGIAELSRQDAEFAAFVRELHRRLAAAGSKAAFASGLPVLLYAIGIAVFACGSVGLGITTVRALQLGERGAAALLGVFCLLFIWQVGSYLYRNRPATYRTEEIPPFALPRG